MTKKDGINRRDFLKISSMSVTAGILAGPNMVNLAVDGETKAANDPGGFFIRYHDHDNPPYDIDHDVYARKPGHDTAFGRNPDKTKERLENTHKNLEVGRIGDDWLAYAYAAGAATFMFDNEMYSWDKLAVNPGAFPAGRWVPEEHGYTTDDTTKIIKRAAKLYGASLVGIAPTNPLWFYQNTADMGPAQMVAMMGGDSTSAAVVETSPETQQLRAILVQMEPEEFKTLMLDVLEDNDTASLPVPPAMLKAMPAAQIQEKLPQMLGNMDPAMQQAIKDNLDPALLAEMPDTSELPEVTETPAPAEASAPPEGLDMGAMMAEMSKEIVFSDEVEEPVITDDAKIIPKSMNRVVVMAFEMDEGGMNTGGNAHVVSQLGEAAAMDGYSRMAFTSARLAQFIRRLGYNAIPMGNDHALSIPMAVDAGLGELGRNGVLITPRYGPRVRLAKVMTDMPLMLDRPISFGVTEFCDVCGKCAEQCPSGAIIPGERTYDAPQAGIPGLLNWPVDGDKCFGYWAEVGGSCYNCIRVCPFNKPEGWLHDATRMLIGVRSGSLDQILLKLDDASGYGSEKGIDPTDFWDIDTYIHIKS